jgi:hypothetical protein
MRAVALVVGALVLTNLVGCSERQPGPPVPLRSFALHDIQGLFGGEAIWVAEDRTAIIQIVEEGSAQTPGLWERRYMTHLSADQWAEMERLVGAHNFLSITMPERLGVPDEAHPLISVTTKDGTTTRVRKWANDKHRDFDVTYGFLRNLCRTEEGRKLIREGQFDWSWKPDGFERPW